MTFIKPNGCDENGWDHFGQYVRDEFILDQQERKSSDRD